MGYFKGGKLRRLAAGVGSAALALTMLGGLAAQAADPGGDGSGGGNTVVDNIDANRTGKVTLYKYSQPDPAGTAATGLKQDVSGMDMEPLQGVDFTLEKADAYDLTTVEGWKDLEKLTPDTVQGTWTDMGVKTTDASGMVEWENLPIGLYRVTEGTDHGNNHIVYKSAPFLLTLPMNIENEWKYEVFVYPKNAVTNVTKTVDDAAAQLVGDEVSWTVTAQAPRLVDADKLKQFKVSDTFDPRLEYVETKDVKYNGTPLAAGDYTVNQDGQKVTVALTADGLAKVKATPGEKLEVTFVTKVLGLGKDGIIKNKAIVFTHVGEEEIETESNEVETKFGSLKIVKQDGHTKKALKDAKFQIFASEEEANKDDGKPIKVNANSTVVIGADGTAVVTGLKVDNATGKRTYWVKEIEAPAGYSLNSKVYEVEVSASGSETTLEPLVVDNVKKPKFDLPLTGSTGTMIFLVGGGSLVALGAVLALVARKRKNA